MDILPAVNLRKPHLKATLWPLFMDTIQLPQGCWATTKKPFTFITCQKLLNQDLKTSLFFKLWLCFFQ